MDKPKYILSDPYALKQIKLHQYIWQGISIIVMALGFLVGTLTSLYLLSSVVVALGVGLFFTSGLAHRYKHKIPVPQEDMFVSPMQGKLRYSHGNEEITVINISRVFLDLAEIRSPHPGASIVDGQLRVVSKNGNITFRFNKLKVEWLPQPDFARGNVIGTIRGHGSCTISIPAAALDEGYDASPESLIIPKVGKPLDICENLFALKDKEA